MRRPSNKEIKAAVEKLKEKPEEQTPLVDPKDGKPEPPKSSRRIRKQGV